MARDAAVAWLTDMLNVSRETLGLLERYERCVITGQREQNLVGAGTIAEFWTRHIVDAAQLVMWARTGQWLDIGSGAGIPGIVTAILTGAPTILVEPRTRRAQFLHDTVSTLALNNVIVVATTLQKATVQPVDVITARAVAALPALIEMAQPFAHNGTVWLLPKGKSAKSELASLPSTWQGEWALQPSVTDDESFILVGRGIRTGKGR